MVVARSDAKAEFRAIVLGVCVLLWLKKVMMDLEILENRLSPYIMTIKL